MVEVTEDVHEMDWRREQECEIHDVPPELLPGMWLIIEAQK
jgi:hypothetical protein